MKPQLSSVTSSLGSSFVSLYTEVSSTFCQRVWMPGNTGFLFSIKLKNP